ALVKLKTLSKHVVITMSAEGALISDHDNKFKVPARKITAVDANGADDAFAGSFSYALNSNLGLKTATELPTLICSQVVSQFGPRLAIEDYAALLQDFQKECA